MNALRTLLYVTAAVAVGAACAEAQPAPAVTGAWKLSIGANAVCELMLAPDGTASYASECATGNRVARWRAYADKLELRTASGETVGILIARGGSYAGRRFSDGRILVLSR